MITLSDKQRAYFKRVLNTLLVFVFENVFMDFDILFERDAMF